MRADWQMLRCALLLVLSSAAWARNEAGETFLKQPTSKSAASAWEVLLERAPDEVLSPYNAAAELYPLDDLDSAKCGAPADQLRSALPDNPFALVGLLALSLCAEQATDTEGAARWHAAMAQWFSLVLADGRGRSPAQPAWISGTVDIDALELATGRTATGRYAGWYRGQDDTPLLYRIGLVDEQGRERELFFAPFEIYRHSAESRGESSPLAAARRAYTQDIVDEWIEHDPLLQGFAALRQWSNAEQRTRARQLAAAGDAALAFRILLRCLPLEGSAACVDADIDPLLDSEETDALVLRGLLAQQASQRDAVATRTLFKALQRRVGPEPAIVQVWRDFEEMERLQWLPEEVLKATRARADAAADPSAASAYLLARHPRSAQDRVQADQRLQRAAQLGHGAAQVRLARRLAQSDPAAAKALYRRAAAGGNRIAQLQLLQLEYANARPARRAELVALALPLIRKSNHAAALWIAQHHASDMPEMSYIWALQAVAAPAKATAQGALEQLIEHASVGTPALGTLRLDALLERLQPDDGKLSQWCQQRSFAQACRHLFERRTLALTAADALAAEDLALLERAAALGDREALRQLGQALVLGEFGQSDPPRGLGLIDRASGMGHIAAQNDAAWLRCSSAHDRLYQPQLGLSLATHLLQQNDHYVYVDTLAACQAANGKFSEAVASQQRALEEALQYGPDANSDVDSMRARLQLYGAGKAYRED